MNLITPMPSFNTGSPFRAGATVLPNEIDLDSAPDSRAVMNKLGVRYLGGTGSERPHWNDVHPVLIQVLKDISGNQDLSMDTRLSVSSQDDTSSSRTNDDDSYSCCGTNPTETSAQAMPVYIAPRQLEDLSDEFTYALQQQGLLGRHDGCDLDPNYYEGHFGDSTVRDFLYEVYRMEINYDY